MKTLERLTERCSTRQALITCERCQLSPEGRREGCFGNAESCRDVLAARLAAIEDVLGAHYNLYEIQAMLRQGRSMQQKRKEKGGLSMERLTTWTNGERAAITNNNGETPLQQSLKIPVVIERLAKIEDILGNEYDLDRLRELIDADREGRCTIFPCRDWLDLVFGEQEVFYGIDTDYIENPIREITVHNEERFIWYDGWKNLVFCGVDENGLDWEFSPEEVGKTVFLTEEQAESALKAMKEREDS